MSRIAAVGGFDGIVKIRRTDGNFSKFIDLIVLQYPAFQIFRLPRNWKIPIGLGQIDGVCAGDIKEAIHPAIDFQDSTRFACIVLLSQIFGSDQ